MKKAAVWMAVLAAVLLVAWAGFRIAATARRQAQAQKEMAELARTEIGVSIVPAVREPVEDRIQATGSLAAMAQILVYSRMPGKLSRNLVRMNQYVTQDEVIALVDQDEPGFEFSQAEVKSPMAGVVAKTYLDPGGAVTPMTPIAQIVSTGRLKAMVSVVEREIGKIQRGQPAVVRVDAYQLDFPGKVTAISPVVDPQSRAVEVEITLPNPGGKLKPGMFARAEIQAGKHDGLVVPASSVQQREGRTFVMVVGSEVAREREVVLGQDLGEKVEIASGLQVGELVVTAGAYGLKDGEKIRIQGPSGRVL